MKPSHLREALLALLPELVSVHIWGATGIGKSDIVRSVAHVMHCDLIDLRAVLYDPVDLRGLPRIHDDVTEWILPKFLPRNGRGVLFLDELTSAPQLIQAACYQLVLDRRLGDYCLPDEWYVVAAGNPASERGVHFAMPRPLRDRFEHLTLEPDLQEWCQWAVAAGIRPEIIAFLRFKPELLHVANPSSDANAWPTPRGWQIVSRILTGHAAIQKRYGIAPRAEVEAALMEGKIGPGAAAELIGFLRLYRELPSIDEILLNPDKAPVPNQPSSLIAIATALARALTPHSIGKGLRYLERIPTEFRVLSVRDATARDRALAHTPEFVRFAANYAELIQ